jgi:hypothetical protein
MQFFNSFSECLLVIFPQFSQGISPIGDGVVGEGVFGFFDERSSSGSLNQKVRTFYLPCTWLRSNFFCQCYCFPMIGLTICYRTHCMIYWTGISVRVLRFDMLHISWFLVLSSVSQPFPFWSFHVNRHIFYYLNFVKKKMSLSFDVVTFVEFV